MPPISPKRSLASAEDTDWQIVYDADCGLCSRIVTWIRRRERLVKVGWLSIASDKSRRLVPDRLADEMAVIGPHGEVWFGGDAFLVTFWTLARWRWLARLLALPGFLHLIRWGYPILARRRYWISRLLGDSCQIR